MPTCRTVTAAASNTGAWPRSCKCMYIHSPPCTLWYRCELYRRVFKPRRSVVWLLHAVNVFCFIITLLAIIGSVQSIVVDASTYKFFS